jgi:hypothetical protein
VASCGPGYNFLPLEGGGFCLPARQFFASPGLAARPAKKPLAAMPGKHALTTAASPYSHHQSARHRLGVYLAGPDSQRKEMCSIGSVRLVQK